jgi:hypothetical protein
MNTTVRNFMAITLLGLVAGGCASGRVTTPVGSANSIIVNGESVQTSETQTVLEVLSAKVPASLLSETAPSDDQPIVLLDGVVLVDGVPSLGTIAAFHVVSVSTMRATEAVPLHGSKARNGAIVVKTKRGR